MPKTTTTTTKPSGTLIAHCNCTNQYQDQQYGPQQRVFNLKAKTEQGKARCTVCERIVY